MTQDQSKKKTHAQEIRERREVVARLIKFKTEIEIAKIVGKSRETVLRDVKFLKKSASEWLEGLAKGGFVFEYKNTLEKIKEHGDRLQEMYDNTDDPLQKLSIIKEQDRNDKLYFEMLGNTATVENYKKVMGEKNAEAA